MTKTWVSLSVDFFNFSFVLSAEVPAYPAFGILTSLSASSFSASGAETEKVERKFVDIMSVNIWNYNHWSRRKSILANELRKHQPDIIGMQEVRARKQATVTASRYQVEELACLLENYQFVFEPAMGFQESDHEYVHEGLAIFSRYPILAVEKLELSRDPYDGLDFHQRLCLRALVSTPIGDLNFLTTHLSLSETARSRTLHEIGKYASTLLQPTILVGDFNMEMDSSTNVLTEYGFDDAWSATHGGESEQNGWTFNNWDMKSRIDYVLLKGIRAESVRVVGEKGQHMTGLKPVGGVSDMRETLYPSDHRFLLARVLP